MPEGRLVPGTPGVTAYFVRGVSGYDNQNTPAFAFSAGIRALSLASAARRFRVLSRSTSLPGSPALGDAYIVPDGDANEKQVAVWDYADLASSTPAWLLVPAQAGDRAYVLDANQVAEFDGTDWGDVAAGATSINSLTDVDGGTVGTGRALMWSDVPDPDGALWRVLVLGDISNFPGFSNSGDEGKVLTISAGGGALEWATPAGGSSGGVLDMAFWKSGTLGASEVLFLARVTRAAAIADDLAGSQVYVGTNPTATAVLSIRKNGTEFGTISISTGGAPTLATSAAAETLAAGDRIEIVAPASADASLADVSVTLKVDAS